MGAAASNLLWRLFFLAATTLALGMPVQAYPDRPIRLVVPFPPGASTDTVARLLQAGLAEALSQAIVVDNRAGAGGTVGAKFVADAKPDGYTLLLTVSAPITSNRFLQKAFPFNADTAFEPIIIVAGTALLLATNTDVPASSVSDLVNYARRHPKQLTFGSAGVGTAQHVAGELLGRGAGIDIVHVPYRGSALAMQDLVAGNLKLSFGTPPAILPHAARGTIRVLAVAESKRFSLRPDIPTISETVPGVAVPETWIGLLAPAGTPRGIIERLNEVVGRLVVDSHAIEQLKNQGIYVIGGTPARLRETIVLETQEWGRIFQSLGLKPD